jgi:hypothetical protein
VTGSSRRTRPSTISNQIQIPVAIEVAGSDAMRMWLDRHGERRVWCGREFSSAVAQQHRQLLCLMVCKCEIETAIAVKIADGNIVWTMSGWKRRPGRRRLHGRRPAEKSQNLSPKNSACDFGSHGGTRP